MNCKINAVQILDKNGNHVEVKYSHGKMFDIGCASGNRLHYMFNDGKSLDTSLYNWRLHSSDPASTHNVGRTNNTNRFYIAQEKSSPTCNNCDCSGCTHCNCSGKQSCNWGPQPNMPCCPWGEGLGVPGSKEAAGKILCSTLTSKADCENYWDVSGAARIPGKKGSPVLCKWNEDPSSCSIGLEVCNCSDPPAKSVGGEDIGKFSRYQLCLSIING